MILVKITSETTEEFILVPSDDMQDVMYAVERAYQERRTPKATGNNEKLRDPLLFDVYGTATYKGYASNGMCETFTAETISYRNYVVDDCVLLH